MTIPDKPGSMAILADLLNGYSKPVIEIDRVVPSTTYDLDYRLFVIAATFETHAKPVAELKRINTARLKLMQFVVQRPWLLQTIRDWGSSLGDAQLKLRTEDRFRRGYLSDTHFESTVDFAVAQEFLSRTPTHLSEGRNYEQLSQLLRVAERESLFISERSVVENLKQVKVTNEMLGAE